MKTFTHISTLQNFLNRKRLGKLNIAFVPTMGALHNGHLTLVREAMQMADIVVASIFVNPTQFDNKDDLKKYPRQTKEDKELLKSVGCHVLFKPTVSEVYPPDFMTPKVDLGGLAKVMEGANRVGHFEGVVEVVSRLFDIVEPDIALFGEKDFQQLAVLRRMTSELNYKIDIHGVQIIRERSGLAMSSRNQRLSKEGKSNASFIHKTLTWVKKNFKNHEPKALIKLVEEKFEKNKHFELEYFEIADNKNLKGVKNWNSKHGTRAFVVAWIEGVRLIDNMELIESK